jgi:hypothetical protein
MVGWAVAFSKSAGKQYDKLNRSGSRPPINDAIDTLVIDLQKNGPHLSNWPNYGPLEAGHFHCHLRKGKPTYVACWRVIDKQNKQIEVYYVRSHEGVPY